MTTLLYFVLVVAGKIQPPCPPKEGSDTKYRVKKVGRAGTAACGTPKKFYPIETVNSKKYLLEESFV